MARDVPGLAWRAANPTLSVAVFEQLTTMLLAALAVVWGLLLMLGVKLFDRETILTRWR